MTLDLKNSLLSDCLFNAYAYCPPQAINRSLLINTVGFFFYALILGKQGIK